MNSLGWDFLPVAIPGRLVEYKAVFPGVTVFMGHFNAIMGWFACVPGPMCLTVWISGGSNTSGLYITSVAGKGIYIFSSSLGNFGIWIICVS